LNDLQKALRAHLLDAANSDSAHDVGHTDRVWANSQRIASDEVACDMIVLLAACYLHDLVTLPKNDPQRHLASQMSADAASPVLNELGYTQAQTLRIQHAIIAHSFSANVPPETIEAKVLQDADRIEALGAIGIARCFAVSGALGRPLFHSEDPFATERPLDDSTYAVDHFACKLLRLPDTMQTVGGRKLAQERANTMRQFLDDLAVELNVSVSNW
jgi:uncharacterized protein